MNLPRHIALEISHNQHKVYYEPLALYMERWKDEVDPVTWAVMLETDEVWECYWYPDTPIGHCRIFAASLEQLLGILGGIALSEGLTV